MGSACNQTYTAIPRATSRERAWQAFRALDGWLRAHDYTGMDPYDLRQSRARIWLEHELPKPAALAFSRSFRAAERVAPRALRRAFAVNDSLNPNTLVLCALSYLELSALDPALFAQAKACLSRLLALTPDADPDELGWGYPFDWWAGHNSQHLIAKHTPLAVVTTDAGRAFLALHARACSAQLQLGRHTRTPLQLAQACARLLLRQLRRAHPAPDETAFSYGTMDDFRVLNVSANVAAFLCELAAVSGDSADLPLARQARAFVRRRQLPNGAFPYWDPAQLPAGTRPHIDGYHTGMVLQFLARAQALDPLPQDEAVLARGEAFYRTHMFDADAAPRSSVQARYPIDIHAVAQGLVTCAELSVRSQPAAALLPRVVDYGLAHMQNRDGSFAYRRSRLWVDRTPYMRWGGAWMAWGLARALSTLTPPSAAEGRA